MSNRTNPFPIIGITASRDWTTNLDDAARIYYRTSRAYAHRQPGDCIWLESVCEQCLADYDHTWCDDDVYDVCPYPDCNNRATPYRLQGG